MNEGNLFKVLMYVNKNNIHITELYLLIFNFCKLQNRKGQVSFKNNAF